MQVLWQSMDDWYEDIVCLGCESSLRVTSSDLQKRLHTDSHGQDILVWVTCCICKFGTPINSRARDLPKIVLAKAKWS
jgi:hypothetical protein